MSRYALSRLLVCSLTALAACSRGPIRPVHGSQLVTCDTPECLPPHDVEITYLGVAGFAIRSGERVLLTAPHFTNPSEAKILPEERGPAIEPDTALIRRLFPDSAKDARAIIVGHGHYDHLLDVPFIARNLATRAFIYGSRSVANMLMGDSALNGRIASIVNDAVGSRDTIGKWIKTTDGGFQIMALRSSHAPALRFLGYRHDYAPGIVDTPYASLPRRGFDWKAGEVYAYLIDVLDARGQTVFRIYYQDTATDFPLGTIPKDLGGRRVDVAILCVASARNARPKAPDALVAALNPRYVIAGHWESFFTPQTEKIEVIASANFRRFAGSMATSLRSGDWSTPYPKASYRFRTTAAP